MDESKLLSAASYIFGKNEDGEWCILAAKRAMINKDSIKHQGGLYNVPVGIKDSPDEPINACAQREVKEETCLTFPLNKFKLIGVDNWAPGKYGANMLIVVNDITKYIPQKGDWENELFHWLPVKEIGSVKWAYGMDRTIMDIFSKHVNTFSVNENKLHKLISESIKNNLIKLNTNKYGMRM